MPKYPLLLDLEWTNGTARVGQLAWWRRWLVSALDWLARRCLRLRDRLDNRRLSMFLLGDSFQQGSTPPGVLRD